MDDRLNAAVSPAPGTPPDQLAASWKLPPAALVQFRVSAPAGATSAATAPPAQATTDSSIIRRAAPTPGRRVNQCERATTVPRADVRSNTGAGRPSGGAPAPSLRPLHPGAAFPSPSKPPRRKA